ncbi:MAG: cytochrome-c oxidase, cbb3-type subunit III [Beijerinckiaceae bacterium]
MASESTHEVDKLSGITTTGHEWDGLKELNNPLPRWWLYTMYLTIVWGVIYMFLYPTWPLVTTYTKGLWGYSSRGDVAKDLADLQAARGDNMKLLATTKLEDIPKNEQLVSFVRAYARTAFGDNCAPCHGAGAGGVKGHYPNLLDDDWLWGGKLSDIEKTIRFGIRSGHDEARVGDMPAFGRDGILKPDQIDAAADYVLSLSNQPVENKANIAKGAAVFKEQCASCHGEDGKGKQEFGGPNLTDAIWLYGSDKATIVYGLNNGRGSVMPQWQGRLDEPTIKALAVYVHALGGGK